MKKWSYAFSFATLLAVWISSCAPAGAEQIVADGLTRTYHVYRPAALTLTRPVPLVVVLHGGFGTGEQAERAYGWDRAADRHGFVVAYPDGYSRTWNGGSCCGPAMRRNLDDVAFLERVIREVSAAQNVDPHAVAIAGMSNGAIMAYRMACESTVPLRAIGSVAGTMLVACSHPQRTSVIEIHGLADRLVPFEGGTGVGVAHIQTPPLRRILQTWRSALGCDAPQTATSGAVTTQIALCPGALTVELVTIAGAGHQWPGSAARRVLGDPPSGALDATETLYRFFFGSKDSQSAGRVRGGRLR